MNYKIKIILCKSRINKYLKSIQEQHKVNSDIKSTEYKSENHQVRLPKLEIYKFFGDTS